MFLMMIIFSKGAITNMTELKETEREDDPCPRSQSCRFEWFG